LLKEEEICKFNPLASRARKNKDGNDPSEIRFHGASPV